MDDEGDGFGADVSETERRAALAALDRLGLRRPSSPHAYESAWRQAGLRERAGQSVGRGVGCGVVRAVARAAPQRAPPAGP